MAEGDLSGVGRPVGRWRDAVRLARAGDLDPKPVLAALDELVAVDALAAALDRAMDAELKSDGGLDLRAVAARVLADVKAAQR